MYRSLLWISALVGMSQAAAEGIRWHPGHYVILNGGGSVLEHLRHIDDVGGEQHIRGVMIRIWWYELETSRGRYDFSKIETYLDQLRRQPTTKRLVVRVMDRRFGTTSASNIVPSYLRNDRRFNGGVVRTKTGYAARLWERPVMDRRIALYRAMALTATT